MSEYTLIVTNADANSTFVYRTELFLGKRRVADSFAETRWGARRWAKAAAKKDRRESMRAVEVIRV